MAAPTQNDWNWFQQQENLETKTRALYAYLCQNNGDMQTVAQNALGDYNSQAGQRVSVITRCYGFSGRNSGVFSKMGATVDDVAAFVRAYPDGCTYGQGKAIMEQFLRNRISQRSYSGNSSFGYQNTNSYNSNIQNNTRKQNVSKNNGEMSQEQFEIFAKYSFIFMPIFILIALFVLHWNFLPSLIVGGMVGVFVGGFFAGIY